MTLRLLHKVGASQICRHTFFPFQAAERAGRVTGEKRLRKLIQEGTGERLKPIGHMRSPFKTRTGCPRQGGLVPHVRSEIVFDNSRVQPENSLDGISTLQSLIIPMRSKRSSR